MTSIANETGLTYRQTLDDEYASGTYVKRLNLASGRFAMLDNGTGFKFVLWTPAMDLKLGLHVSGVARDNGSIDWHFGCNRGPEI